MPTAAPRLSTPTAVAADAASAVQRIAAFLRGASFEAAYPAAVEIAALRQVTPERTRVYLTAPAGRDLSEVVPTAARLRGAGFEPVAHVAVRGLEGPAMLDDVVSRLVTQAGVRRLLVIAGDHDRPAGPYGSALDLIESGLLQRYGIVEVGVAGYPEGHPRISDQALEQALLAKIEAAEQTGLAVHVVTQFTLEAAPTLRWIARLRDLGVEHPVRIGMAGPSSLATLLRYARRCGVRASAQGVARNAGLLKHLVGTSAPNGIIRPLVEACADGRLGQVAPHFYSFGGLAATGRWVAAAAHGHIALDRARGFSVQAP
jgi:methylenetetrahydrofolate reductase (NADPH)